MVETQNKLRDAIHSIPQENLDNIYKILRCPDCASELLKEKTFLKCTKCLVEYPLYFNRYPIFVKDKKQLSPSEQIELDNLDRQVEKIHRSDWRDDYNIERIELVDRLLPEGLILDLGAADGQIATFLSSSNRSVVALEKTTKWLEVHGNVSIPFVFSDIYRLPFAQESFDGLLFGEILEHVYDPVEALKRALFYLRQGGSVVGTVPNFYFAGKRVSYMKGNFGEDPDNPLNHEHIRQFSYRILKKLLNMLNLTNLKVLGIWQKNFFPMPFFSSFSKPLQTFLAKKYPSLFAVTFVFYGEKQ